MSLLLLLQLLPPQVILLQFKLNDVHTQSSDLEVGDQPMELGETGEKRKKKQLLFISKLKSDLVFQLSSAVTLKPVQPSSGSPS